MYLTGNLYLKPIKNESQVRSEVYERLRQAILKNQLKPGNRLIERKIAEQLEVSRTPVREAIRMLEREGLVYHIPRSGVVVAQVSDKEVLEVYRIRAVLEGLAARMAAEKITPEQLQHLVRLLKQVEQSAADNNLDDLEQVHREFNDLIYRATGSPRLYGMINSLVDFINRFALVGYCHPGRIDEATREHRQLVEAIKLRDGDLAERIARDHIENSRRAYFAKMAGLELDTNNIN